MSSTAGDEGQGGRVGAKEVRTYGLLVAAIFICVLHSECILSENPGSFHLLLKRGGARIGFDLHMSMTLHN